MDMNPLSSQPYLVVGHRGGRRVAPENTMAAFRAAWANGADMIELDVRRTQDGVLVLSHDASVDRCTNGHGRIADLPFATIQQLRTRSRHGAGEAIATLDEALAWARGKIRVNIHIKNADDRSTNLNPGIEQQIVAAVRAHGAESEVMLSSFNRPSIEALKRENPQIQCGLLISSRPMFAFIERATVAGLGAGIAAAVIGGLSLLPLGAVALAGAALGLIGGTQVARAKVRKRTLDANVDVLVPNWPTVDRRFIAAAHARGKRIVPYAVNAPYMVNYLTRRVKVDGIITDTPERFTVPRNSA